MSTINNITTNSAYNTQAMRAQSPAVGKDADGDHDGSKPGQTDTTSSSSKLATSGSVGTIVNTTA